MARLGAEGDLVQEDAAMVWTDQRSTEYHSKTNS